MAQGVSFLFSFLMLAPLAAGAQPAPPSAPVQEPVPAAAATPAPPALPGATIMQFVQFGDVPVFRPAGEPSQVVILLSGDKGVGAQEAEVGNSLAAQGALVLAVDVPRYVATVEKSKQECLYPGAELRELSQNGQARNNLASYHTPILVGVGAGGSFAFVSLAQAPRGNFAGAISIGFCPLLMAGQSKELCHSNGLRWDRSWAGPGIRLLPDRRLEERWIVLATPTPPAGCPAVAAPDIVPAMRTASRIPVPAGASPEAAQSAWKTALPQALADIVQRFKESEALRKTRLGDLADLPVVEVPAEAPEVDVLAIDLTGSGGYEGLDIELGKALAAQGVPLVAISSLDYFWTDRDLDGAARDLARILDHYLKAWHKKKAVLIGYSQGADIIPFMVNRLPEELRSRIGAIGLIGPDEKAELDNGLSSFSLGRPMPPPLPVGPEIERLKDQKLVCVYGEKERRSLCPRLDPKLGVDLLAVPSGHAFQGEAALMIARVLKAGGFAVRAVAPKRDDEESAAPARQPDHPLLW